ncbi:unnamed protein product [Peronospora belbahrii]|uniref:t-SNARE coiled-coil homology domain-containing protein n=1 Tax=Peronospora belbahrii TaxID=622444 RepID=A0AAU9L7X1_9STRA|nr:unnamed protein product [Peronospora belbahrii]
MMMEDGELRDAELTGEFNEMSTPKLEDRMDKALQDQDQQLDAIYTGVTRLHLVADATNEEVLSQNAMLDQVVVQVNDTEAAVQQQTKAARKVARAHRELGCYYHEELTSNEKDEIKLFFLDATLATWTQQSIVVKKAAGRRFSAQ